jgi:hypothetical protein
MTAPRGTDKALQQNPIEHSVYIGRRRLGRYVQTDRKKFKAFAADDRPLGTFRVRKRSAISVNQIGCN